MTLEVSLATSPVTAELAGGPTVTMAQSQVTVELSTPGTETVLLVSSPTVTITAAAVAVALSIATLTLDLGGAGPQGPPGPQQIFVQDAEPGGAPTYPLLWFDTDGFGAGAPAQMKVWRP